MTEQIEQESIPASPEVVPVTPTDEVIDLIESPFQQQSRAFWFKITIPNVEPFHLTVIAVTSNGAREGIKQQFPDSISSYLGVSDKIMQIQEQTVVQ